MRLTTGIKHVFIVTSYHVIKYSFTVFKHNKTEEKKKEILTLELAVFDLFHCSENRASLKERPCSSQLTALPAIALRAWQMPRPG